MTRYLEYSFSSDPDAHGTMVDGEGDGFLARVGAWCSGQPAAERWHEAVARFTRTTGARHFYLKVDWRHGRAARWTIYGRYPEPVERRALDLALCAPASFRWNGAPPHDLSAILGDGGRWMIGLRGSADGSLATSLYVRILRPRARFVADQLPLLSARLALPDSVAATVAATLSPITGLAYPAWIGIDSPTDDRPAVLKIDVAGIVLGQALSFAAAAGASPRCLTRLAGAARGMRVDVATYLGTKFAAQGFAGWKLYMEAHPTVVGIPRGPRLRDGLWGLPPTAAVQPW
jgi:hypothetical protein